MPTYGYVGGMPFTYVDPEGLEFSFMGLNPDQMRSRGIHSQLGAPITDHVNDRNWQQMGVVWLNFVGIAFPLEAAIPKTANVVCRSEMIADALKLLEEFLAKDGIIIKNTSGDLVLMKGNQKIRMDLKNPHGDAPHFHTEYKNNRGKWKDTEADHRHYFNGN